MPMNITTKPVSICEQKGIVRPELIWLPKPGESDPWTGLGRSSLNRLCANCGITPPFIQAVHEILTKYRVLHQCLEVVFSQILDESLFFSSEFQMQD